MKKAFLRVTDFLEKHQKFIDTTFYVCTLILTIFTGWVVVTYINVDDILFLKAMVAFLGFFCVFTSYNSTAEIRKLNNKIKEQNRQ